MSVILNSILPVCAVILLGQALKRLQLANKEFFNTSDRLIYYIFFPAMLFWKTGTPNPSGALDFRLGVGVSLAVLCLALLSLIFVKLMKTPDFAVGSFSQCCYRFNSYVGMAVILSVFNEEGVRLFAMVILFSVPFINVLAVSTLIWFSGTSYGKVERLHFTARQIFSNPLILGCILGMLYSRFGIPFPMFIENTLKLTSSLTLPMALLSIGYSLETSKVKGYFGLAMASSCLKLVFLPLIGCLVLTFLGVSELPFRIAMVYFALPTATSIYILSAQLNSDVDLASAGIVVSTILSVASLSVTLLLLGG